MIVYCQWYVSVNLTEEDASRLSNQEFIRFNSTWIGLPFEKTSNPTDKLKSSTTKTKPLVQKLKDYLAANNVQYTRIVNNYESVEY